MPRKTSADTIGPGERYRRRSELSTKAELAALSDFAFHGQLSVHGLHQPRRYGQTQPHAAVPSCRRRVRLLENLENGGLPALGYPNARVRDRELQTHVPLGLALLPDFYQNLTGFRELDGIVDEIENDLPEAVVIADHELGTRRSRSHSNSRPFSCARKLMAFNVLFNIP